MKTTCLIANTDTFLIFFLIKYSFISMKAELEPILFSEREALRSHQVNLPCFDHPLHHHPEVEVVWIQKSSGMRMIGDAVGAFQEGEVYVLGSSLPHLFFHQDPPPGGALAEVLQFRPGLFAEGELHVEDLFPVRDLVERAKGGFCVQKGDDIGRCLTRLRTRKGASRWAAFFHMWDLLLAEDLGEPLAGLEFAMLGQPLQSERIQRVCSYLMSHFQEEIRMEDMARMAHYSPAAFSRRFKQATRKTFTDFLTELRLCRACTLLLETDWPILRISLESGFQNLSNFNRRFRNHYGVTPREYRR